MYMNNEIKKLINGICTSKHKIFGNFLYHILYNYCYQFSLVLQNIEETYKLKFNTITLLKSLLPNVAEDIHRLVLRTLIVDINQKGDKKLLKGATSKDKYNFYNDSLLNKKMINEIFRNYPVLDSIIDKTLSYELNLIKECLIHLYQDSNRIKKTFNINTKSLNKIEMSSGDTHNKGKKVIILYFNDNMLVYKPHSLSCEQLFNKISIFLNNKQSLKHDITFSKCIDCKQYGWQEFITYKECVNQNEVKIYYYRIGTLLSLFYLFSSTDIHYDNLISHGSKPIVFDLETLVHNSDIDENIYNDKSLFSQIIYEYQKSVISTMLLPTNNIFGSLGTDIGGISTKKGHQKSNILKSHQIINQGTNKIRMKEVSSTIYNEGKNILNLNGKSVSPLNYINEINSGFYDCYKMIISFKNDILELIRQQKFTARQVLRPTNLYCKFLNASTYPLYFTKLEKRYNLFSKFKKNIDDKNKKNIKSQQVAEEIVALMRNDIPYFTAKSDSTSLFSGDTEIKNFYKSTLFDNIKKNINNFSINELNKQINYIQMSLHTLLKANSKNNMKACKIYKAKTSIKLVKVIADNILKMLIWNKEKNSCTMMYTSVNEGRVTLLDGKLYYMGGVILLFAYLGWHLKEEKYISVSKSLVNGLKELKSYENYTDNFSFFTGLGSYIYIYYTMFALFKDQSYYNEMLRLIYRIKETDSNEYNVISGPPATIIMLLNIYNNIKDKIILDKANLLGELLLKNISSVKSPQKLGLAHGFYGPAWSLIKLGIVSKNPKFTMEGKCLLEKEKEIINKNTNISKYWCTGKAGIELSHLKIDQLLYKQNVTAKKYNEFIEDFLNDNSIYTENHSLCHGSLGIIDVIIELSNNINDKNKIKYIIEKRNKIIDNMLTCGIIFGGEIPANDFSFMLGLSGIAYCLLRVECTHIPSMLSFDVISI